MSKTIVQEEMVEQIRRLCQQDKRITAALMYGSIAREEGDEFSDIEFFIFINNADSLLFDYGEWVGKIAPMAFYFISHLGHGRAIFKNLIRGEFHFQKASEIAAVRGFKSMVSVEKPEKMLILDRTGELQHHLNFLVAKPGEPSIQDRATREKILWQCQSFIYAMLSGFNLLARGERVHAVDQLCIVQRFLLPLAIDEDVKWQPDTRALKYVKPEVNPKTYNRYVDCTGSLHHDSLERAYISAWSWGKDLMDTLMHKYRINLPRDLIQSLDARFVKIFEDRTHHLQTPNQTSGS